MNIVSLIEDLENFERHKDAMMVIIERIQDREGVTMRKTKEALEAIDTGAEDNLNKVILKLINQRVAA
jgi:hypothetical protein